MKLAVIELNKIKLKSYKMDLLQLIPDTWP